MQAWPLRSFCSASLSSLDRPLYASDAAVARSRLKIKHQQRSTGFVRGWTRVLCFYSRFLAIEKKTLCWRENFVWLIFFLISYSALEPLVIQQELGLSDCKTRILVFT